ncbi:NADPH-dependent FMN reductase [Archangium lipolyticum]|uniref:NADPH-dependent FMN reductase n=1 Tax=Archangium lipolyticum TaxID=2970465 RepID=UPI002149D6BE|nr:NAD(P)H-dependent oxidoreductase [Archangium lipolyticum]
MNEQPTQTPSNLPGPAFAPLRLAIILGSVREGRFADTLSSWLVPELRRLHDGELDVIDLRHAGLSFGWGHEPAPLPEGTPGFDERIAAADGFVFVVPEYNHSFPGPLKTAIDQAYSEWNAKPAAFVSYGGTSGGLRAVEQLRLVLGELHVVDIRDGVSFPNIGRQFDANGQPRDAEGVRQAVRLMLGQLEWWARALQTARRQRPYGSR